MLCWWFFFSPSSWRPNCCHIVLAFWGFNSPSWASATTVLWTETFLVYLLSSTSLFITELTRSSKCTFNLVKCNWRLTHASPSTYPHSDPQTPFFFFFFFILANCTDIQVLDLTKKWILVENAEKNVLKVGRPTAIIFLFCNSWVDCSYSRISSLFFEASRRPLRALWFVPSWFTDNWVVLCRLASKGVWKETPFESTGNRNLNCCN